MVVKQCGVSLINEGNKRMWLVFYLFCFYIKKNEELHFLEEDLGGFQTIVKFFLDLNN